MSKKSILESLGTFPESEATEIARALSDAYHGLAIAASTSNLRTDSGPTTWWHVNVHPRQSPLARAWLKGWNAGRRL